MAGRWPTSPPWDNNCRVTTYVDGFAAMSAMRDALETVITNAPNLPGAPPIGQRGYVYIAGWRFNCMRDLSQNNAWGMGSWPVPLPQATLDQTAMGLVVRLLQAGVMVRIMVWTPTKTQTGPGFIFGVGAAHTEDHYLAARIVDFETRRIEGTLPGGGPLPTPLGVVALDFRTADITAASHHQKMMVIRSGVTNVAFVGGVDLAYTRRSYLSPPPPPLVAPPPPPWLGDWQSGPTIPNPANWWPRQAPPAPPPPIVNYGFQGTVGVLADTQGADLPAAVYGASPAGDQQMWHDQHLKLEGPIVATIEEQFRERWVDQPDQTWAVLPLPGRWVPKVSDLSNKSNWTRGQVIFSTSRAYNNAGQIVALPAAPAVPAPLPLPPLPPPPGTQVQMWRTIPYRKERTVPPFTRGEFTVMAGIDNAVRQAQQLIWMFDQYFWSLPLARLLNRQLQTVPTLRLILILPPYADGSEPTAHLARKNALQALTNNVQAQVGVYNMWYQEPPGTTAATNRGIYVHAKSHTYDNSLLVCGSANLNRRSFFCDTELACAVLDPAVVTAHQQQLWAQLFPGTQRPAINLNAAGSGAQFFNQFQAAANAALNTAPYSYRLIRDPWALNPPQLPNQIARPVASFLGPTYDSLFEPSSVNPNVDTGTGANRRLDEIVVLLENTPDGGTWPWRKP
jgi:phosphatidylserine/phosphatidylglycerophosphate/cardiolipin synthase-like enzyme